LPPLAILLAVAAFMTRTEVAAFSSRAPDGFGAAEQVASLLLSRYLLAFELISIVLLVAIVGALALGKIDRRQPWK
jgi:NADH:ubiquinone oxidoreductase subunit 6 (subunit J)